MINAADCLPVVRYALSALGDTLSGLIIEIDASGRPDVVEYMRNLAPGADCPDEATWHFYPDPAPGWILGKFPSADCSFMALAPLDDEFKPFMEWLLRGGGPYVVVTSQNQDRGILITAEANQ